MSIVEPIHCRRPAYDRFAMELAGIETTGGLIRAASALAMHELEAVDPAGVMARIEHLADRVQQKVQRPSDAALLAHLHEILFEQEGYHGNAADYYHPHNSYLPVVLQTKCGLPITLCLIYKGVAEAVGLDVQGTNSPGHFLAAVETRGGVMYVDPFYGGGVLNKDEVFDRIARATGQPVIPRDELLQPATHREWLSRMLNNLQATFAAAGRLGDLAAMQELQALL